MGDILDSCAVIDVSYCSSCNHGIPEVRTISVTKNYTTAKSSSGDQGTTT